MTAADFDRVARFYDLETEGLNEDIPFYLEYAQKGGTALELACGTGRVLIPLAEAGINAIGLDISGEMLKVAKAKSEALPEKVRDRVELLQGDMRHFDLGRRFPFIFRYEMELLLGKYGFELADLFGGFDRSPYNCFSGGDIYGREKITNHFGLPLETRHIRLVGL